MKKLSVKLFVLSFVFAGVAWGGNNAKAAISPAIFYSDIANSPAIGGQGGSDGAFVTIWGRDFGTVKGASFVTVGGAQAVAYPVWSNTKISFQITATTPLGSQTITVTTADGASNQLPFYVNSVAEGVQIFFCDIVNGSDVTGDGSYANSWATPDHFLDSHATGNILYIRDGLYTGKYGTASQVSEQMTLDNIPGAINKFNAIVGYPGEAPIFQWMLGRHIRQFGVKGLKSSYWTFANLTLDGNDAQVMGGISGGGANAVDGEETGAHDIRVVNLEFKNSNPNNNAMTALMTIDGDNNSVYGCSFHDNYAAISGGDYNNIHQIYVRIGSDNVDLGWNSFYNNHCGFQIQVHTDNNNLYGIQYDNVRIHNNHIKAGAVANDVRGLVVGDVGNIDSTIYVYNNFFDGNDSKGLFPACQVARGTTYLYNNTFYKWGGDSDVAFIVAVPKHLYVRNNIFFNDGITPYMRSGNGGSGLSSNLDDIDVSDSNIFYNGTSGLPAGNTNGIYADPLLVNPANGDISLQIGSPAINSGLNLISAGISNDYYGILRPQSNWCDRICRQRHSTRHNPTSRPN
jgi:hypothetical protein